MKQANTIDSVMYQLKWPAACFSLLLLPGAVISVMELLRRSAGRPGLIWPFLVGCALYAALWYLFFRHRVFGTFLSTFEHELTHALFALATLHPVTELRATAYRGGRVSIRGQGNWLITIAPYFFPTVCVLVGLMTSLLSSERSIWVGGLMGFTFAYHVVSTKEETHAGQSDLQRVGFGFAWLFLPAAVLISLGGVVAYSHGGWGTMLAFFTDVLRHSRDFFWR
jgi:hypothetical protein